jgi:hypothetical protein
MLGEAEVGTSQWRGLLSGRTGTDLQFRHALHTLQVARWDSQFSCSVNPREAVTHSILPSLGPWSHPIPSQSSTVPLGSVRSVPMAIPHMVMLTCTVPWHRTLSQCFGSHNYGTPTLSHGITVSQYLSHGTCRMGQCRRTMGSQHVTYTGHLGSAGLPRHSLYCAQKFS